MNNVFKTISSAVMLTAAMEVYAAAMPGYFMVELGPYWASEGETQHIEIDGLLGDKYTADANNQVGGLFGLGYLFHGYHSKSIDVDYGVTIFYLTKTQVTGDIIQEFMFENLSYEYSISHVPVYAEAKATFKCHEKLAVTLDAGIGPNFLLTSGYKDEPLNSTSLPDNAYLDETNTSTVFSAMVGIGLKSNVYNIPLELGYRFFYLGEGSLEPRTDTILDDLSTGTVYVNALMLTISI